MQRIAVFNTAFLGDAVLTLPLIQSLRLRYPQAVIDFYVRGGLRDLFASHPALNEVHSYDKRGRDKGGAGFLRLARFVASRRYTLWISAHASPRSGLLALASGAATRIGYDKPGLNRLFYTRLVQRRFTEREEIERLLALLEPLGPGPLSDWPDIVLPPEAVAAAKARFAALKGPVLGLHPGSVWATKRWPAASFAAVGVRAIRQGAHVLLFAGPGEEAIAEEVLQRMRADLSGQGLERLHNLAGRLALPELAACLGRLSCYLTNDSGPMHLAWAQRTPVTAVFGPTVRALGFFPRGPEATVFETDEACRPCGLHGPAACPLGHHRCMTGVGVDAVWGDVAAKLQRHAPLEEDL